VARVNGADIAVITVDIIVVAFAVITAVVVGAGIVVLAVLQVVNTSAKLFITVITRGTGVAIVAILGHREAVSRLLRAALAHTRIWRNRNAFLQDVSTTDTRLTIIGRAFEVVTTICRNVNVDALPVQADIFRAEILVITDDGLIDALAGELIAVVGGAGIVIRAVRCVGGTFARCRVTGIDGAHQTVVAYLLGVDTAISIRVIGVARVIGAEQTIIAIPVGILTVIVGFAIGDTDILRAGIIIRAGNSFVTADSGELVAGIGSARVGVIANHIFVATFRSFRIAGIDGALIIIRAVRVVDACPSDLVAEIVGADVIVVAILLLVETQAGNCVAAIHGTLILGLLFRVNVVGAVLLCIQTCATQLLNTSISCTNVIVIAILRCKDTVLRVEGVTDVDGTIDPIVTVDGVVAKASLNVAGVRRAVIAVLAINQLVLAAFTRVAGILGTGVVVIAVKWEVHALTGGRVAEVLRTLVAIVSVHVRVEAAFASGITCVRRAHIVVVAIQCGVNAFTVLRVTRIPSAGIAVVTNYVGVGAFPGFRVAHVIGADVVITTANRHVLAATILHVAGIFGAGIIIVTVNGNVHARTRVRVAGVGGAKIVISAFQRWIAALSGFRCTIVASAAVAVIAIFGFVGADTGNGVATISSAEAVIVTDLGHMGALTGIVASIDGAGNTVVTDQRIDALARIRIAGICGADFTIVAILRHVGAIAGIRVACVNRAGLVVIACDQGVEAPVILVTGIGSARIIVATINRVITGFHGLFDAAIDGTGIAIIRNGGMGAIAILSIARIQGAVLVIVASGSPHTARVRGAVIFGARVVVLAILLRRIQQTLAGQFVAGVLGADIAIVTREHIILAPLIRMAIVSSTQGIIIAVVDFPETFTTVGVTGIHRTGVFVVTGQSLINARTSLRVTVIDRADLFVRAGFGDIFANTGGGITSVDSAFVFVYTVFLGVDAAKFRVTDIIGAIVGIATVLRHPVKALPGIGVALVNGTGIVIIAILGRIRTLSIGRVADVLSAGKAIVASLVLMRAIPGIGVAIIESTVVLVVTKWGVETLASRLVTLVSGAKIVVRTILGRLTAGPRVLVTLPGGAEVIIEAGLLLVQAPRVFVTGVVRAEVIIVAVNGHVNAVATVSVAGIRGAGIAIVAGRQIGALAISGRVADVGSAGIQVLALILVKATRNGVTGVRGARVVVIAGDEGIGALASGNVTLVGGALTAI